MKLLLSQVLWETRGVNWDYRIICKPAFPPPVSWYKFLRKVFDGRPQKTKEQVSGGMFSVVFAWGLSA